MQLNSGFSNQKFPEPNLTIFPSTNLRPYTLKLGMVNKSRVQHLNDGFVQTWRFVVVN